MRRVALLPVLIAAIALAAVGARADSVRQQQSVETWHRQNLCAREAFQRFPDYTPEGNAARDKAIRACEARHHLPPRADLHDSPVKTLPDAQAE